MAAIMVSSYPTGRALSRRVAKRLMAAGSSRVEDDRVHALWGDVD